MAVLEKHHLTATALPPVVSEYHPSDLVFTWQSDYSDFARACVLGAEQAAHLVHGPKCGALCPGQVRCARPPALLQDHHLAVIGLGLRGAG